MTNASKIFFMILLLFLPFFSGCSSEKGHLEEPSIDLDANIDAMKKSE